jgi:hypothetical protein
VVACGQLDCGVKPALAFVGACDHSSSSAARTMSAVRGSALAGTSKVGNPRRVRPAGYDARSPLRARSETTAPSPLPRAAARLRAAR